MCKGKDRGGLGIEKIIDVNNDFLTKVGWKLLKDEVNWCGILRAKYIGNLNFIQCIQKNNLPIASRIWVDIVKKITWGSCQMASGRW